MAKIGFRLRIDVESMNEEANAGSEIRKIMDDLWQRYPYAVVEKGYFNPRDSEVDFEI